MYYQVLYFDNTGSQRCGTGVYAETEQQAREVAAVLLNVSQGVSVNPASLTVVEVDSLESDIPTTT